MPSKVVLLAALLAVGLSAVWGVDYVNNWDGPVDFECPDAESIGYLYSIHSNTAEDRRWKIACRKPPSGAEVRKCEWTPNYVNQNDRTLLYMCPANYVISGVKSVHSNRDEDRRYKFKCCKDSNYVTTSCTRSDWLNNWDGALDFTVANGRVLTGWFSVHDNSKEDRRHKFITCQLKDQNS
ncbi:hypothetical protein EGW08_006087 [Elysia chlorotica]|uniref:Dermatopontin n=1 Tax=Elysia chlorotica TaxID=188477 RepID=A0A433TX34_ELYCH|nr:hypothetical protein EGW08_006087 [Elysia chlorotica]